MKPHEITDLCACLCLAISLPCAAHAALDVQCVSGPALKFREGGDTIVVMYSNTTIRVTEAGALDMLLVGGGGGGGTQGGGGGGGGGVN